MQKQEVEQQRRRIASLQERESVLLMDKQKLIGERDAFQFQLTSLTTELHSQKSSAFLQSQRFDQETMQLKEQVNNVQKQLELAQVASRKAQLDLVSIRSEGENSALKGASMRAELDKAIRDKSKLH